MWIGAEEVVDEEEPIHVPLPANRANNIQLDVDCYHHLINVWFNAITIGLCKHAQQELSEDLKEIDIPLRVKIELGSFIRGLDKWFNKKKLF